MVVFPSYYSGWEQFSEPFIEKQLEKPKIIDQILSYILKY